MKKFKSESTKTKAVLGGKTKLYMVTMKSGKELIIVALSDEAAKSKAEGSGEVKKVTRLNRKSQDLYTV